MHDGRFNIILNYLLSVGIYFILRKYSGAKNVLYNTIILCWNNTILPA